MDSMGDYREKTVAGLIFDATTKPPRLERCNVTVRMTSDEIGQSLSMQAGNVMIEIPLEHVAEIIRVTEKEVLA